jgi:hypothetical protein
MRQLTGAVRRPVQRVLGILLDEATGRILVQDAGQQGLIRDALLKRPAPESAESEANSKGGEKGDDFHQAHEMTSCAT